MNHYENWAVRARIAQFLGAESNGSSPNAVYFATADGERNLPGRPRPLRELSASLRGNLEIYRPLWDRESLLADLDIEYVNFDCAAEPYIEFERTFALQEPLRFEIEKALLGYGIAPLHLLSGRGHHFIWRIRRNSSCYARLAHLDGLPLSLKDRYDKWRCPSGEMIDHGLGNAFVGLGRIIEYFAAEIKKRCAPALKIPIELSAIEVGPSDRGREMISFDISQYADPLYARFTRAAYSRYLKAQHQRGLIDDELVSSLPPLFVIPLYEMNVREAVQVMRDPNAVTALASYAPANIPDCSTGSENLLNSYLSSELAQFHSDFYAEDPEPPERWAATYDRIDMSQLPACIQVLLEKPNDLLLRPACMRRVVITLLSLGWHPRHISGLIKSRFERDFGWNHYWEAYDPTTRAEFFTRVFSGLVIMHYDDLIDFNCCSTKEEQLCFQPNCQENLERFKTSLLNRRAYARLARRPFHRLFLPPEHPELPGHD
jgi:hypothetical protein